MPHSKHITSFIFFILCLIDPVISFSQNSTRTSALDSANIEGQFEYIYKISNNYEDYEVVRRYHLDRLQSNVLDSIARMQQELRNLNTIVLTHQDSIQSLKNILEMTEAEKEAAIAVKDRFVFFGIPIQKSLYSYLMWILVGILSALLITFSVKYYRSFSKIKKAENDLEELRSEFELHRKNTLERERKLKRELIDAQMGKS